jgi:hypothetical protein
MADTFPQTETLRRTDLHFRSRFPWVKTQLFETTQHSFLIFVPSAQLDAQMAADEFNHKIRPVTLHVQLSNDLPQIFLREISTVPDEELGQIISLHISRADIQIHINSHFPDFPDYVDVAVSGREITFGFADALAGEQVNELRQWVHSVEPELILKVQVLPPIPKPLETEILRVLPPKMRPFKRPYIVEDEDFWHQNVKDIYAGGFRPHDIVNVEGWGSSCLIDATNMETIDLRQALLCFDTVLLHPPLSEDAQAFRDRQRLSDMDLATLAESGRLRLVMQQPEERLDWNMIDAVLEASRNAIIGRRRSSALIAADIVDTSEHYLLSNPDLSPALQAIAKIVGVRLKSKPETVLRSLLWPVAARRGSFERLDSQGLMGVAGFSVGNEFSEGYEQTTGRDVRLEAMMFGSSVQVAHAFNATLIPAVNNLTGWNDPMRMMGEWLNFYRSFNSKIAAAWIGNQERKALGIEIMPAIPIFKFERHAAITDILDFTRLRSDHNKGRALISRLADLPMEQRTDEIERLSKELFDRDIKRGQRKIAFDVAKSGGEIAGFAAGLNVPPIAPMVSALIQALRSLRSNATVDAFFESLEADLPEGLRQNHDLDFLSKVYRVAKLIEPSLGD